MGKKDLMRFIFSPFLGKKLGQDFFEQLQLFAIKGRHFGGGSVIKNSGELYVLSYIADKLKLQNRLCPVIFDVGANTGEYSAWTVKKFMDKFVDFKVLAFEPAKKVFQLFKRNRNEPQIEVFNFGFSNQAGTSSLFMNDRFSVASSYL